MGQSVGKTKELREWEEDQTVEITVTKPPGRDEKMAVPLSQSIREFKIKMLDSSDDENLPVVFGIEHYAEEATLLFGGIECDGEETFESLGIEDGATVTLTNGAQEAIARDREALKRVIFHTQCFKGEYMGLLAGTAPMTVENTWGKVESMGTTGRKEQICLVGGAAVDSDAPAHFTEEEDEQFAAGSLKTGSGTADYPGRDLAWVALFGVCLHERWFCPDGIETHLLSSLHRIGTHQKSDDMLPPISRKVRSENASVGTVAMWIKAEDRNLTRACQGNRCIYRSANRDTRTRIEVSLVADTAHAGSRSRPQPRMTHIVINMVLEDPRRSAILENGDDYVDPYQLCHTFPLGITNEWYHICFSWDLMDGKMMAYKNGVPTHKEPIFFTQLQSGVSAFNVFSDDDDTVTMATLGVYFRIQGREYPVPSNSIERLRFLKTKTYSPFYGKICDFTVLDCTLTQAQARALYDSPRSRGIGWAATPGTYD